MSVGSSLPRRSLRRATLALTLSAAACSRHRHGVTGAAPSIERGDRVVIEQTAAQFFEGRVLAVSGDMLKIQTADRPDSLEVHRADAYRLPPAAHQFRPGDLAICEMTAEHWTACRVDATAAQLSVTGVVGRQTALSSDRVLAPTPVTRLNLQQRFQTAQVQAAFQRGLEQAGRPHAPKDWVPDRREHVLAERPDGWYSATVHRIRDKSLTVIFRGDRRSTELQYASVVPEPPYSVPLAPGDYLLARPVSLSEPWKPVRVTSAVPDSISAVDIDGNKVTLSPHDAVPLKP
jgi:hypothetical protein